PSITSQSLDYWFDGVFVTSPAPDTTPPVISNVNATPGANRSAAVTWTTNEASTSRVDYGTTAKALTSNVSDSTLVTSHNIALTRLAPPTTYFFRLPSAAAANNRPTA